jgi:hypothetical protein
VTNSAELLEALQDVARNLGLRVRPYTATPRAPFASYVAAMARTGVLVARHGPLLANAAFLPPGARLGQGLESAWTRSGLGLHACRWRQQRRRRWPGGSELLRRCHLLPTAPLWPALRRTVTAAPGGAGAAVVELLPYNWEWRGISQVYANVTRSLGDVHHFAWRAGSPQWAVFGAGEERYAAWSAQECSSRCYAALPSSPLLRDQRCQKLSADVCLLAVHFGRTVTTDAAEAPCAWPSHDAGRA